jgi:hypothetical protein
MHPSRVRYHGTKIVDYAIRAGFVSVVVIPLLFWLSMSGGLGSEPPEHGEQIFGIAFFIAIAPGVYAGALVHAVGISSGLIDWMLLVITIPLFWGAVAYGVVQFGGFLLGVAGRQRVTKRYGELSAGFGKDEERK